MFIHIGITALSLNNDLQQRKKSVAGSESSYEALYTAVLYCASGCGITYGRQLYYVAMVIYQ